MYFPEKGYGKFSFFLSLRTDSLTLNGCLQDSTKPFNLLTYCLKWS